MQKQQFNNKKYFCQFLIDSSNINSIEEDTTVLAVLAVLSVLSEITNVIAAVYNATVVNNILNVQQMI